MTAAIVSSMVTVFINRKVLLDSLDSKSGWRKEIFKVASKTFLTTDDVYLLLAALRYKPHEEWINKENKNKSPVNFTEMTSYMHYRLEAILDNYEYREWVITSLNAEHINKFVKILNRKDTCVVRIMAKYLLKHHWENLGNGFIMRRIFKARKEKEIIKEVFQEIELSMKDEK